MAAHKCAHLIAERGGAGVERIAAQIRLHIGGELLDRRITALRFLPDRHHYDAVEIPAQLLSFRALIKGARRRRSLFADDARDFERAIRLHAERARAGEEFVEEHAHRVDVRGRGNGFAAHLLRARVFRRHQQPTRAGSREARKLRVQKAGDAEIEKFRYAAGSDQNVGRFDIAVDYEVSVSILDGAADYAKKAQPIAHRQVSLAAVRVDRDAFHIFHDEVRQSFHAGAAVEKTRDVGVIQLGQDLSFGAEAKHHAGVRPEIAAHDFEGDLLLVSLIGAAS